MIAIKIINDLLNSPYDGFMAFLAIYPVLLEQCLESLITDVKHGSNSCPVIILDCPGLNCPVFVDSSHITSSSYLAYHFPLELYPQYNTASNSPSSADAVACPLLPDWNRASCRNLHWLIELRSNIARSRSFRVPNRTRILPVLSFHCTSAVLFQQ